MFWCLCTPTLCLQLKGVKEKQKRSHSSLLIKSFPVVIHLHHRSPPFDLSLGTNCHTMSLPSFTSIWFVLMCQLSYYVLTIPHFHLIHPEVPIITLCLHCPSSPFALSCPHHPSPPFDLSCPHHPSPPFDLSCPHHPSRPFDLSCPHHPSLPFDSSRAVERLLKCKNWLASICNTTCSISALQEPTLL